MVIPSHPPTAFSSVAPRRCAVLVRWMQLCYTSPPHHRVVCPLAQPDTSPSSQPPGPTHVVGRRLTLHALEMDAAEAASTHPTSPPCRLLLAKPVTSSLVSALVPPPLPHRSSVVRCRMARLVRVMDAASAPSAHPRDTTTVQLLRLLRLLWSRKPSSRLVAFIKLLRRRLLRTLFICTFIPSQR